MTEIDCGLIVKEEKKLRCSAYRLVSHVVKSLCSHYPNEQLKRLNDALYHLNQIKEILDLEESKDPHPFDVEVSDIILQIEKLIKVHMKNVWK